MKSFINNKNAAKIPYPFIVFFLFLYVCPNIRYFGVGEMSYLPGLIIIFAYSFLNRKEFIKYFSILFLCIIWPFWIYSSDFLVNYSSISYLVSLYILTIPVLSSILLGRIIGTRFAENKKIINQNELKKTIILLTFSLLFSGILNQINPSILNTIIYTGRSSAGRWTFFFTEPSQVSSVLLIFWVASILVIFKKDFYDFLGKNKIIFYWFIPFATFIFTYLSLPNTLISQLLIFFSLIISIYSLSYLMKFLFSEKLKFKNPFNRKIKKYSLFSYFLLFVITIFGYIFLYQKNGLLVYRLNTYVFNSENLFLSIFYIGGFRFYYSFAALVSSFRSPLHFPGGWSDRFAPEMISILNDYDLMKSDAFLQLSKSFSVIKPLGWFYFSIYDLGFLGFIIFCLLFFRGYMKYLIKGILKQNFIAISLFSVQIALLLIPILPSTPSVFFPLLIYSALNSYSENKKINLLIEN